MSNDEHDFYSETRLVGISDPDPDVRIGIGTLEGLLDAMRESDDLERAADRLLEALVSLLGLSRASLELIEERAGIRMLAPLAAAGEHAALARDMPSRRLASSADAAEAAATRSPVLVGDLHGVGDLAETDSAIARWRAGMSAQAYAVLPLVLRQGGDVIGVLTVEWSTPHEFDTAERDALMWMATSLAEAVASFGARDGSSPVFDAPGSAAEPAALTRLIALAFDPHVGISFADDSATPESGALRVTFALAEPQGDRSAALWDLIEIARDEAVILVGLAEAPAQGASLLAERARQLLRASVLAGVDAPGTLATLGRWARATAHAGSRVSAAICRVSTVTGELHVVLGDTTAFALLGTDGRVSVHAGGLVEPPIERSSLVLADDQLVLTAGAIGPAAVIATLPSLEPRLRQESAQRASVVMAAEVVRLG